MRKKLKHNYDVNIYTTLSAETKMKIEHFQIQKSGLCRNILILIKQILPISKIKSILLINNKTCLLLLILL